MQKAEGGGPSEEQSIMKKTLQDADGKGELISNILALSRQGRRPELGAIISELHNARRIYLASGTNRKAIGTFERDDFWRLLRPLKKAIPELELGYEEILRLAQTLVEKAEHYGGTGVVDAALVQWFRKHPKEARKVISKSAKVDPHCLPYCSFALQGLQECEVAFELLTHSDKSLVAIAMGSLGSLQLDDEVIAKRVIDKCLEAIAVEDDFEIKASAIETAFKTWERTVTTKHYRQEEVLKDIVREEKLLGSGFLSTMLLRHQAGLTEESIGLMLSVLKRETSDPWLVLRNLDAALCFRDERWNFKEVMDTFSVLISRLSDSIEPAQLHNFCHWVWQEKAHRSLIFSSWLLEGDTRLCSFLADMIGGGCEERVVVEIFKTDLPDDEQGQTFVARKCVGFFWLYGVTAASVLFSIVKHGKKAAREYVENLLYDPLLVSYGGLLRSFLEEQSKNTSKRVSDCAKRLLEEHDTHLSGLDKAKYLVELAPSNAQRRIAAIREREWNKEIQKQAQEKSLFAQLATPKMLLYGKQSFSLINDASGEKVANITPLSEYSYRTELPMLSVFDHAGFDQMIRIFRVERRGVK